MEIKKIEAKIEMWTTKEDDLNIKIFLKRENFKKESEFIEDLLKNKEIQFDVLKAEEE